MRSLICVVCGKSFNTNHSQQINCSKECAKVSVVKLVKTWRKENSSSMWASDIRKRYWPHLSNEKAVAEYYRLLSIQDNRCAICKQPETATSKGKIKKLSVDHCHRTQIVRGLLCWRCNSAVGLLRDNVQLAQNLIVYLVQ